MSEEYISDNAMDGLIREDQDSADSYCKKEDCPVCHGAGATTDHHDPCTECGGSGKVGGED